jgi:hypothetical protein
MSSDPNPQIGLNAEGAVTAAAILHAAFWDGCDALPEAEDFEHPDLATSGPPFSKPSAAAA